jgi:hypothetical protein
MRLKIVCSLADAGIFELFFDKDLVQRIENETSHYAQQFRDSRGSNFSRQSRIKTWQLSQ